MTSLLIVTLSIVIFRLNWRRRKELNRSSHQDIDQVMQGCCRACMTSQTNSQTSTITTIPFKQNHPSYGISSQAIDKMRANGGNGSIQFPQNQFIFPDDDNGESEDEIWNIKSIQKVA